jgi:hypothetical protein
MASEPSRFSRQLSVDHLGRTQQQELLALLQQQLARPQTVAEARAAREAALVAGATPDAAAAVALGTPPGHGI